MKSKNIVKLILFLISLTIMSCTDTGSFFDNEFLSKSKNEKMITCLNKALVYTQKNENNMLFMKARGYKWSDLKYGLLWGVLQHFLKPLNP